MSFELPITEKDYYVFTEHPEIIQRAKELGLDNFVLHQNQISEKNVLDAIKEKHKIIVRLSPSKNERPAMGKPEPILPDSDLCIVNFNPWGRFILDADDEEGHEISTIEGVSEHLLYFVDLIEVCMHITGITYKCGNCHTMFSKDDKYCRVCGTERGKGTYLPYEDQSWYLYGAPIKKRYKCSYCGNIWISRQWNSKYCPECGKKTVKQLNDHSFLIRCLGDYAGSESPYDSDVHSSLFSEKQVLAILQQRKPLDSYDYFVQRLSINEISKILKKAGVSVPETTDFHYWYLDDDKLSDQMNLTQILLFLEGNDPYSHQVQCPHCKSKMAAGICYNVYSGTTQLDNKVHMPATKDSLTFYDSMSGINIADEKSIKDRPAYVCLQCGDYYGEFKLSKLQMRKYQKAFHG